MPSNTLLLILLSIYERQFEVFRRVTVIRIVQPWLIVFKTNKKCCFNCCLSILKCHLKRFRNDRIQNFLGQSNHGGLPLRFTTSTPLIIGEASQNDQIIFYPQREYTRPKNPTIPCLKLNLKL